MFNVCFRSGYTVVKVTDPDFYKHLNALKNAKGPVFKNNMWFMRPEVFNDIIERLDEKDVAYFDPEWQCRGKIAEAGPYDDLVIDEIGREFGTDKLDKRAYQDVGACFLYCRKRSILADEVGIGKTPQSLLAIGKCFAKGDIKRAGGHVLVLTEAGLVYNYSKDARKLTQFTVLSIEGDDEERSDRWARARNYDIVITGHEKLRIDHDFEQMLHMDIDLIIVDEVNKFNNRTSDLHKQLDKLLTKKNCRFMGLTATPTTGDPINNLYALMRLIDKSVLGNVKEFEARYIETRKCTRKDNGRTFWAKNPRKYLLPEIRRKIAPYIMQRSCADVGLEKPDYYPPPRFVAMTDDQRRLTEKAWADMDYYQERIDKLTEELESFKGVSEASLTKEQKSARARLYLAIESMENKQKSLFTFLRMVADGMELLKDYETYKDLLKEVKNWKTPKIEVLSELLPELFKEGKVVLHTDFKLNIPVLKKAVEKITKLPPLTIVGQMKAGCKESVDLPCGNCPKQNNCNTRRHHQWMFQNDDRYKIILMTSAGEKGLNLQIAKYQINYDVPWNPSSINQRFGRIYRYGSEHDMIYNMTMISVGSVEEVILDKIITKKEAATEELVRSRPEEIEYIRYLASKLETTRGD